MVKVGEIYGGESGRFLNARICDEEGLWNTALTIVEAEVRTIRDREKIVISFEEIEDVLVLNATNARILAEAYGDDTDDWKGKRVSLRKVKRTFQGKLVDAIEVEPLEQEYDMSGKSENGGKKSKKGGRK